MNDDPDTDADKTVTENDDTTANCQLLPNHDNGNKVEPNLNDNENTNLTEELKSPDLLDTKVTQHLLQTEDTVPNLNEDLLNKNNSHLDEHINELFITTNADNETEDESFINVEEYRDPLFRTIQELDFWNIAGVTDNHNTNPRSNVNVSLAPTQFLNDLAAHWTLPNPEEVMENEPRHNLVQFPEEDINYDLELLQNYNRDNIPRAFNYNIDEDVVLNREPDNRISLADLHVYHNASLNALANENVLMDELYHANHRLNIQHNLNVLRQNNVEVGNGIPNVEINRPNNVLTVLQENPMLPHLFRQNRHQEFPLDHLVLVANGGINPLNGGHNGNQWVPARELLLQNNGTLDDLLRDDSNNEEFNQEDGPASDRGENSEERNR